MKHCHVVGLEMLHTAGIIGLLTCDLILRLRLASAIVSLRTETIMRSDHLAHCVVWAVCLELRLACKSSQHISPDSGSDSSSICQCDLQVCACSVYAWSKVVWRGDWESKSTIGDKNYYISYSESNGIALQQLNTTQHREKDCNCNRITFVASKEAQHPSLRHRKQFPQDCCGVKFPVMIAESTSPPTKKKNCPQW